MGNEIHQHPPTYTSTGNLPEDFRYAAAAYEADIGHLLPRNPDAQILDVGCGWGQFLWWAKEKGYALTVGIDIGQEQEAHGRQVGLAIRKVDDSRIFLESLDAEYDLIVMNHVIEHVFPEEGLRLLAAIRRALKPGGRVIIQTPNMNCVGANAGRYIELSHVVGYSESSLHQLMSAAGFNQVEMFGNVTRLSGNPKRILWKGLQVLSRAIWRTMLFSELGFDAPKIVTKNLYATGIRD